MQSNCNKNIGQGITRQHILKMYNTMGNAIHGLHNMAWNKHRKKKTKKEERKQERRKI